MNKQQLYIKGIAVDMPAEDIKIKVESNLFSDAGSLMTAHSYSINLPRTMTNDSIFALAYVPSAETGGVSTHRYLPCSLYYDGIPLFDEGKCLLTSVEDSGYKCNLFWGLLNVFDRIKEEDLSLNELPISSGWDEDNASWRKVIKYMGGTEMISGMNNDIYATLDSDSKALADTMPWTMPFVKASKIIDTVCDVYGLTIDWSAEANSRLDKLLHPLVTLKAKHKDERLQVRLGTVVKQIGGNYYPTIYEPSLDADGVHNYARYSPLVIGMAQATEKHLADDVLKFDQDYQLVANTKFTAKSVRVYGECSKQFSAGYHGTDIPSDMTVDSIYDSGTGLWRINHEWVDGEWEKGGIVFYLTAYWNAMPDVCDIHFEIDVEDIGDLEIGQWWCVERNYPEVGIIKYFSDILAHIGGCIVGSVTKASSIKIMTFDEVAQASPQLFESLGVKSITMSFDKLAQRNQYIHKDNEDTGMNYTGEGYVYTADASLEYEAKAFESVSQ